MPRTTKNALLIEPMNRHGYVIPAQYAFLKDAGYRVRIVLIDEQNDLDLLKKLEPDADLLIVKRQKIGLALLTIYRDLWLGRYDFVNVNTIWRWIMFALLLQPRPFRANIHRADQEYLRFKSPTFSRLKKWTSPRFWFLQRAQRLYLLSDRVYEHVTAQIGDDARLETYSPSYFPGLSMPQPDENEARVIFSVPGVVTQVSRNYESLIDAFAKLSQSPLRDQIEIRLLGHTNTPVGKMLVDEAERTGLLGTAIKVQKERYTPFLDFAHQWMTGHFTLTLLDQALTVPYHKTVSPSSQMIGRGFAVPFVASQDCPMDTDLDPYTIYYQGTQVLDGIGKAVNLVRSGRYAEIRQGLAEHMQERFKADQRRFLR